MTLATEEIETDLFYIVNVDDYEILSDGFIRELAAENEAAFRYGSNWWTTETPYAVWQGEQIIAGGYFADWVKV